MTDSPKSHEPGEAEPPPEESPAGELVRISPTLLVLGFIALGVGLLAGVMMSSVVYK
jgi:hypothetical protein